MDKNVKEEQLPPMNPLAQESIDKDWPIHSEKT